MVNDYNNRVGSYLAQGSSCLNYKQGNELLDDRFSNCFYVSNWPSCGHNEGNHTYQLFRAIFVNFKQSMIWRTLGDDKYHKVDLKCAFCFCKHT